MAYQTRYGNYVKFLRGTPTAWDNIDVKDADTLYFIAEEDSSVGKLYLGEKLIADGETAEINTLSELTDVVISEGVPNGAVLAYDAVQKVWKETLLESILSEIIGLMKGATEDLDGASGLVPQPMAGQQNLFLRGDGSWQDPTTELKEVVSSLDEVVKANQTKHEQDMRTLMSGAEIITPVIDIVNAQIAKVVGNAPDAFDTLEELAAWVAKHEGAIDIAKTLERLTEVETTLNDPDDGLVVRMVGVETILNGDGVTTEGLVAQTANLITRMLQAENDIIDMGTTIGIHTNNIAEIYNMLKWQDLYDDGV